MNGSIRRRSRNSWELTIELGRDAGGRRLRKYIHVRGGKADADRNLRALLSTMDQGLPLDGGKETLGQYLERWIRAHAGRVTARTLHGYQRYVSGYIAFCLGQVPISRLRTSQAQEMEGAMLARGLSGTTVLQAHRILHKALWDAVRWGLMGRNIMDAVTPPRKGDREMKVLNPVQLRALLIAVKDLTNGNVISLAARTGARRGELLGLQWSDIDLERGTVSVQRALQRIPWKGYAVTMPKSAKGRRSIAIGEETVVMLRRHWATQAKARLATGPAWHDRGWVFTRPDGRPLDPDWVTHSFENLAQKEGLLGVRFHDLRHTHATLLLAEGVHPKVVQERLGHANIAVTLDTYSHVLPGLQEAAARAFDSALQRAEVSEA